MKAILLFSFLLQVSTVQGNVKTCYTDNGGWVLDGYCLEIVIQELSWYNARNYCAHRGGDLAEIRSQRMQDSITKHLKVRHGNKHGFWIGATDTDHEGVWQWLQSPRTMGYTNWSPGQGPNDHGFIFGGSLEDCAMIRTDENYKWHDGPCDGVIDSLHYSFICQYKMVATTSPLPISTTTKTTKILTTSVATQPAFPTEVTEPTEVPGTTTGSGVIIG